MTDDRSERDGDDPGERDTRSWLRRLYELLHPGMDSTGELITTLATAEERQVIDADSRVMLEGVLKLADMTAGDAMVAAPRMDLLDIDMPYDELLDEVIRAAHSRFPVYEDERENIIGVLMAKDLLKLQRAPELNVRTLLRPAFFVPESKGLNDLLRAFRNGSQLAMVIDEFGRTAGLITLEDVLEEIVGEIEDEFDDDDDAQGDIFALADGTWRVAGDTPPERIAEEFEVDLQASLDSDLAVSFDTVAGLIAQHLGHVPKRGEHCVVGGLDFVTLHRRGGAVRWFKVSRVTD